MNRLKIVYAWFEWKSALLFRDFMKQRYMNIKNKEIAKEKKQ